MPRIILAGWLILPVLSAQPGVKTPRFRGDIQHAAAKHPLDPLSKEEIASAIGILKAEEKISAASRFPMVVLHEPPKAEVLNYKPGDPVRREAFVITFERASNRTAEAIVDLKARKLISWKEVRGVQPNFMSEDYELLQEIVRKDHDWQEAIRKRGITDSNTFSSTRGPPVISDFRRKKVCGFFEQSHCTEKRASMPTRDRLKAWWRMSI